MKETLLHFVGGDPFFGGASAFLVLFPTSDANCKNPTQYFTEDVRILIFMGNDHCSLRDTSVYGDPFFSGTVTSLIPFSSFWSFRFFALQFKHFPTFWGLNVAHPKTYFRNSRTNKFWNLMVTISTNWTRLFDSFTNSLQVLLIFKSH